MAQSDELAAAVTALGDNANLTEAARHVTGDGLTDKDTLRALLGIGSELGRVRGYLNSIVAGGLAAVDADIVAIAALVSAADKLPYATGAGTWALADFSASARKLLVDAANLYGTVAADRLIKIAKVALIAAVNTGGGVFAWANPEAGSIIVEKVVVDVTTVATAACKLDIGTTATNATTLSDNLLDGIDVHAGTGLLGIVDGDAPGAGNGKYQQKLATGKWVTGSVVAGGDSTGIVGFAYIHYHNI